MSIQKYRVRRKPGLNKSVIEVDAKRFAGDASLKVKEVNDDFEISTSSRLDDHEQLKLERLCYFRQWSSVQTETQTEVSLPSESPATAVFSDRNLPVTSATAPHPPFSPRIASTKRTFYPLLMSQQQLESNLQSLVSKPSNVQIRSCVQYNGVLNCATFLAYEALRKPEPGSALEIKQDFVGLTPLYDPGPDKAAVDIVAVPGLGTKAELTFRSKPREDMVCDDIWLRDYLPSYIKDARVLLYGYNSQVPNSNSAADYRDMASTLLQKLCLIREETNSATRPVILIGHSLGGILIKQMIQALFINRSKTTGEDEFYKSCKGFLFFGVPNRGLKNQALIDMSRGQSNSRLIVDLLLSDDGNPSQYLTNLHENFQGACLELKETFKAAGKFKLPDICVFYETEKSPTKVFDQATCKWVPKGPMIMMVDENSARLGTIKHRACPITTTHSDLVKFESQTDPNFEMVCYELRQMVRNIA